MLLALLLLIAPQPETAAQAEQRMAAAAQAEGQWTAVRRFAAPDAVVLAPYPVPAAQAYAMPDPPVAYRWRAGTSYVACDGSAAVNTGGWVREGRHGYFTTIWRRQHGGAWQWTVDSGEALAKPRAEPASTVTRTASCARPGRADPAVAKMAARAGPSHGRSGDGTLTWDLQAVGGGRYGLTVWLWNGHSLDMVIHDILPDPGEES